MLVLILISNCNCSCFNWKIFTQLNEVDPKSQLQFQQWFVIPDSVFLLYVYILLQILTAQASNRHCQSEAVILGDSG